MDSTSPKTRIPGNLSGKWAHWQSLLEEWKRSGQSQADFCALRSIPMGKFRWWKGHIVKRGARMESRRNAGEKPSFVPVAVHAGLDESPPGERDALPLEVVLRSGCVVRVPAGFDETCLVRLIAALESARCG